MFRQIRPKSPELRRTRGIIAWLGLGLGIVVAAPGFYVEGFGKWALWFLGAIIAISSRILDNKIDRRRKLTEKQREFLAQGFAGAKEELVASGEKYLAIAVAANRNDSESWQFAEEIAEVIKDNWIDGESILLDMGQVPFSGILIGQTTYQADNIVAKTVSIQRILKYAGLPFALHKGQLTAIPLGVVRATCIYVCKKE